jgi:hypothetical protein
VLMVQMSTLVVSAGSQIFALIMHVYFACNVILNVLAVIILSNIMGCAVPTVRMSTPVASSGSRIFSLIMHVYFACNVILTLLTVVMVSNIMGCVSERTGISADGPHVNPGRLLRFSNIFINYACLLCLQCNINSFNCRNGF